MTKRVRIENADASDHKLVVQVWDEGYRHEEDAMRSEHKLSTPWSMVELDVWKGSYIIIKEVDGE